MRFATGAFVLLQGATLAAAISGLSRRRGLPPRVNETETRRGKEQPQIHWSHRTRRGRRRGLDRAHPRRRIRRLRSPHHRGPKTNGRLIRAARFAFRTPLQVRNNVWLTIA